MALQETPKSKLLLKAGAFMLGGLGTVGIAAGCGDGSDTSVGSTVGETAAAQGDAPPVEQPQSQELPEGWKTLHGDIFEIGYPDFEPWISDADADSGWIQSEGTDIFFERVPLERDQTTLEDHIEALKAYQIEGWSQSTTNLTSSLNGGFEVMGQPTGTLSYYSEQGEDSYQEDAYFYLTPDRNVWVFEVYTDKGYETQWDVVQTALATFQAY